METGEVSEKIKRGKHTTRHSELIYIGEDTYLMDTPGFSSLFLENIEKEEKISAKQEPQVEEQNEIVDENIDLTPFKDVLKETIFKKTVSKLFDESVKEIHYVTKENFLYIDCKAYLFKFGSYKLDENNAFVLKEKAILDEFFTRVNLPTRNSLTIYANFVA